MKRGGHFCAVFAIIAGASASAPIVPPAAAAEFARLKAFTLNVPRPPAAPKHLRSHRGTNELEGFDPVEPEFDAEPDQEEPTNRTPLVESESSGDDATVESQSTQEQGQEHLNPFVRNRFDPAYPIHNLCGPWNSGRQTSELEWSEPANKLLGILGGAADGLGGDPSAGFTDFGGYNMFLAPGQLYGSTTNVSVAIYIESMSSFRAQTMDFEVDMYLAMGWYDRRLAHNCTHPILITHKFIAERLWTPDLYFLNSKYAYLQEVTTPNFMAIVYPDGLVFKSIRTDVTLSCMMDLQMFPMDEQECPLLIQSYAYVENVVTLNWLEDPPTYPIARNPDLKLNDMVITGTKYQRCSGPYEMFRGTGNWSCIRGLIVMKRLVLFHLIQTYIPTGMLVSVSWMTFWLDARASPARISLTITSLLTLTTMSNGARQDLPQVSYIKAMDIWQTFSQALIFLVLLEYSFVSYFFTRRTFACGHLRRRDRRRAPDPAVGLDAHGPPDRPFRKTIQYLNALTPRRRPQNCYAVVATTKPRQNGGSAPRRRAGRRAVAGGGYRYRQMAPPSPPRVAPSSTVLANPALVRDASPPVTRLIDAGEENTVSDETVGSDCGASTARGRRLARRPGRLARGDQVSSDASTSASRGEPSRRPCRRCKWHDEQTARDIDYYSRFAFPALFTVFTGVYWLYFSVYRKPIAITAD